MFFAQHLVTCAFLTPTYCPPHLPQLGLRCSPHRKRGRHSRPIRASGEHHVRSIAQDQGCVPHLLLVIQPLDPRATAHAYTPLQLPHTLPARACTRARARARARFPPVYTLLRIAMGLSRVGLYARRVSKPPTLNVTLSAQSLRPQRALRSRTTKALATLGTKTLPTRAPWRACTLWT